MLIDSREILLMPFQIVESARMTHGLVYRNPWPYPHDYALADTMAIPALIGRWCDAGEIDLSGDAVEEFWCSKARKQPGQKQGEMWRVQKLFLDALAELYQACGFCEYGQVAAKYSGIYDSNGVDLRLRICGEWVSVNIAREVNSLGCHRAVKSRRRKWRGCDEHEIVTLVAYKRDLDTSRQPWVPVQEWFGVQVELLSARNESATHAN